MGRPVTLIKLPYVKIYRDRHGRVRRYFRRKGQPEVPLPGLPGSDEFNEAYQAALNDPPRPRSPHAVGTLARLIEDYYRSVEFTNLKPSSRTLYRTVLDPIGKRDGHRLVHDMPREKVRKLIEEIGATRPGMANLTRKALRRLLTFAVDNGWRNDNPVVGIPQYRLGTRHTWTDAELAAFEAPMARGDEGEACICIAGLPWPAHRGHRANETRRPRRGCSQGDSGKDRDRIGDSAAP